MDSPKFAVSNYSPVKDSGSYTSSYESSSFVVGPFFANQSCDPFLPQDNPCGLGNYVNYAVNVSEPSDIVKGLASATEHNIRLVIRNTGHG